MADIAGAPAAIVAGAGAPGDAAPAADAGGAAAAGAAQVDPSEGPAALDPGAAPAPAAQQPGASPAPAAAEGQPPAAAPEPRANLTARLAALSRENREAARRAREAEAARTAAEAKATDFETLLQKAATDPAAMDALFKRAGLTFETVVNRYAEQPVELTPEQAQAKAIEDLRKEVAAEKEARAKEAQAAAERAAQAQRAETIATISQTIGKQAEKFEICARLGEEAANDVLTEVVSSWNKAGRPELMPGEFEEAVQAAIELQELRYEERGKKLMKQARAAAAAPAPAAAPGAAAPAAQPSLAPKGDPLPAGLTGSTPISDKDADIIRGLTDKTAPAYDSQRAKPRTINSSLGGSAPPRAPARGAMDPRDALREAIAPFQRQ